MLGPQQLQLMQVTFKPCWPRRDNLRGFFEYCFPLLLKKIFGYDDREASWLYTVAVVGAVGPGLTAAGPETSRADKA